MTAEARHEALLYSSTGPVIHDYRHLPRSEAIDAAFDVIRVALRADPPTILETPDDPSEDDPLDVPTDPVTSEETDA